MKKSRKYATLDSDKIAKISLALATPDDVESWSHGEVTKPETINYKSYKPERGGLFDEIIFGPMIDYRCPICGHKYKKINEGSFCSKTELCKQEKVEILPKISRRNHMGHIKLNSPVVHFWFFKVDHSIIFKLLDLTVAGRPNTEPVRRIDLENLIYYKSHIVLESGGIKALPKNLIIDINVAAVIYKDALEELITRFEPGTEDYEDIRETLDNLIEKASSKIGQDYGIDFYELNEVIEHYSEAKIGTGAQAIEYLLKNLDLQKEKELVSAKIKKINDEEIMSGAKIASTSRQTREKLYKRLQVINAFIESKQEPTSMLIYNLPVIPADLRPLIQLDGGRHSTSDINELYRRVIIRNNRLKQWQEKDAPTLVIQNELRMIQEAVDALIDNARRSPNPVLSKDNRPFKSISDALTGKKGRFRQNLLGKRVDYSGRSVIVVGPNLKMHQCGIPREMAAKLFEPWIIHRLIEKEVATTIKNAKKMLEDQNPVIWPHIAEVIKGRLVLLNRAPTLHRLSIQAFEPVLVRGKAIRLHPLVCTPFNADFDGDQMAVHVPISERALLESRELMLANKNILGTKDGEPIINPSQDMILGIYYLTIEEPGALGEGRIFDNYEHMIRAYEAKKVSLHARVALPIEEVKNSKIKAFASRESQRYIISTVGKFIFNNIFPKSFPFIFDNKVTEATSLEQYSEKVNKYIIPAGTNVIEHIKMELPVLDAFNKKNIAKIIRYVFDKYVAALTLQDVAGVIDQLNDVPLSNIVLNYLNLKTYDDRKVDQEHAIILAALTRSATEKTKARSQRHIEGLEVPLNAEEKAEILDDVWFRYTNMVASILDDIKDLGFKYSSLSGITFAISDILETDKKPEYIAEGDAYIAQLKQYYNDGLISDDDRYSLTIKKWTDIKAKVQGELQQIIKENPRNPIITMINSGARGNISNYVQLAGMRGLMANNTKSTRADVKNERVVRSTVEIPVKSSFIEGLTAFEFYSSTHGTRKGATDTALNTAKSGYLTRRLVDVAQNIVVRKENCGSDYGHIVRDIVDTKNGQIIVPLKERIIGRYANKPIIGEKTKQELAKRNTLITDKLAQKIIDEGVKEVEIRSVLGCNTKNGVCKMCFGKDLATNRVVNIGEAVGIIAAQSIGEPGTQLTMRVFHTGGVAGAEDITGGFPRLIELIDAHEQPWGRPAVISPYEGEIVEDLVEDKNVNSHLLTIKVVNSKKETVNKKVHVYTTKKLRVKVGDHVKVGQKLSEGPVIVKELLELTDTITVQNYLLKEIQKIYRIQGIAISDKYIEIIIRQMMSKIVIHDPGDSKFFAGAIVDIFDYQEENATLLSQRKRPAFGKVVIKGAKQVPLLSDSFLAAASYQETSKILVHAAISSRSDSLSGLKENIIVGKKIPAGTALYPFESHSKYDIRPSIDYFRKPELETSDSEFIPVDLESYHQELEDEQQQIIEVDDSDISVEDEENDFYENED
ncbi:DNA-directed RNA polymerase subunit beta' [Metamycoplasma arthritidis]|uniref:DNA-directed RNA polymerase subunit beta' n=1 Tax=Metamycoplasma arthritidis (strain 158L3-1) TaxID=243272 RepID=RPOC_META1|nr:DNA-directed RNA polymerase subunit beta' [Metamycoplasma arthritidis]B3PM77.1 RecName: Full=DNA-directed RNA polymerase subunit beta'; Short=RNAP subunit beta'; AltName: Full=RNA polymerase subunit beta'; AltName: Full=Transcriptase subunit beta' [Metamycoplasma arthritidis 158L3-1]ACF07129.1 DNA-directed RNA polymerase beta' subunit [Metamycoplasma arthritidis 158L3-1]